MVLNTLSFYGRNVQQFIECLKPGGYVVLQIIIRAASVIRETVENWSIDRAPRLAAAIAYYAMFAIAPLLVIIVAIAGAAFGESAVRGEVQEALTGVLGASTAQFLEEIVLSINTEQAGGLATILSIALLFFGAMGVFGALQDALNTIWGVQPHLSTVRSSVVFFLQSRLLAFLMVLLIGGALLIFIALSSVISGLITLADDTGMLTGFTPTLLRILDVTLSVSVITVFFAMIFKFLPDAYVGWSDVFFGALVTALLFVVGETLLGLYLGSGAVASIFGVAGSLVVLLVWVYYSAQILLLGAEFTQVFARRRGALIRPRRPRPDVPVTKT